MWAAIEEEVQQLLDDVEDAWEATLEALDDVMDDETHYTVKKLMDIVSESLDNLETDDTFQDGVQQIRDYVYEAEQFVDNEDFSNLLENVGDKLS